MHIMNICLSIATLGAYHFWGKAKIRRYRFSQTSFAADRFAYHGTGKELYQGFLKAMLIFGIPYFSLAPPIRFWHSPNGWTAAQSLAGLVLVLYVPIAIVNARRYRCTRASWRGIRFSFRGRTRISWTLFPGMVFHVLTLGIYYPYFQAQRQAFLNSHTYFGNQRFHFTGHGSGLMIPVREHPLDDLWGIDLVWRHHGISFDQCRPTLLFIPFVLGPMWMWLLGQKQKYFWDHTTFGRRAFSSSVIWQRLFYALYRQPRLVVVTLGLAWPWVTVRSARFFTRTFHLRAP